MDVDMEADEAAGPPEAKVKMEPSELPVTRQRAVGGGVSSSHQCSAFNFHPVIFPKKKVKHEV